MHKQRYDRYKERIKTALRQSSAGEADDCAIDSVARQLIAIIDGLWLEYCLHSSSFSLAAARADCYRFLAAYGIEAEALSPRQPE
jgi:hypothetical protein